MKAEPDMLALLCLLQTPTVTVEPQIARIEVHLAAISKATPKPLRADTTVLGDTVAVRFNATDLPKAKAMLAESLRAKWREEKDAWVLYRTPETLKAFETEEYALREASVRASIAAAARSSEEKFDAAPVAARINDVIKAKRGIIPGNIKRNSPLERLANGLIAGIDPVKAARLPIRSRVTYASSVNGNLQLPMNDGQRKAVTRFWSETAELRKLIEFASDSEAGDGISMYHRMFGLGTQSSLKPGKVLLSLIRDPDAGLRADVRAYDESGVCIAYFWPQLPGTTPRYKVPDGLPDVTITEEEVSPLSPKIEQWRIRFGDPMAVDPLEALWGEMFRGVAAKTEAPMCLWFTDREVRRSSDFKSAIERLLQSGYQFKASTEGWIGTPVRLFSKRSQSPSRVALRDMARRTTKFSSPTMRQWFDFFDTVPNGISTLATEWFFNATGFRLEERKRAVVQLWNALPPESLPTNETRVFERRSLDPKLVGELLKMHFTEEGKLEDHPSEPTALQSVEFRQDEVRDELLDFTKFNGEWSRFHPYNIASRLAARATPQAAPLEFAEEPQAFRGSYQRWIMEQTRKYPTGYRIQVFSSDMSTWSVSSKPISVEQLDEATQKEILRLKEQILKRQAEGGPRRGQNIPPEN